MLAEPGIVEVGRDLEEERRAPAALLRGCGARLVDALQQLGQRLAALQVAQARRVRRGDVDGEVGGDRREEPHAGDSSRRAGPRCRGSRRC